VNTESTYAVLPSPMLSMLGIDPYWTGVVELASGGSEERSFAEIRIRIGDAERTVVFGQPDSQPTLGSHTLQAFGLQVDPATGALVQTKSYLP
jgi:predicted aspartyl protease